MKSKANIVEVKSAEELEAFKATAKGPLVLEFVDPENCGACIEEMPRVEKLAAACPGLTVVKVDVNGELGSKLADAWNVEALPTLYHAAKPEDLAVGKATEYEDSEALGAAVKKSGIKCARPRRT